MEPILPLYNERDTVMGYVSDYYFLIKTQKIVSGVELKFVFVVAIYSDLEVVDLKSLLWRNAL